jgi:hypothetical protein
VGPAVIVLDKYFSRGTCDEDRTDRARTDQLTGTLFAALAADVPVSSC